MVLGEDFKRQTEEFGQPMEITNVATWLWMARRRRGRDLHKEVTMWMLQVPVHNQKPKLLSLRRALGKTEQW